MSKSKELLEKIDMFEMANLRPSTTGLPMVIWVGPDLGKSKHGPRIKVQNKHGNKVNPIDWSSVGFDRQGNITNFGGLTNTDFIIVKQFILNNLDGLFKVWNDEIDPTEFANNIKRK